MNYNWTDANGSWSLQLGRLDGQLGTTITLVITKPDKTQVIVQDILGVDAPTIASAGGPVAFVNNVVKPLVDGVVKQTVAGYVLPAVNNDPVAEVFALLATAQFSGDPPVMTPVL